tara:strand:+ start:155 stop:343 length:189 start_codon:yes stop_codon:yes gene_type:complete
MEKIMKLKNDLSNLHEWTEHFGFPSLEPRIIELPESSHIRKMIETMECRNGIELPKGNRHKK